MNDKTKSQAGSNIEAKELSDEELENVHGGAVDIFLHLSNGVKGESMNALDKASKTDVTTRYKR